MIETKAQCPACKKSISHSYHTYWMCGSCGKKYPCINGIPRLYQEDSLGEADKKHRDSLYNSYFGRIYNFLQPFLMIPIRPIRLSLIPWFIYFLLVFSLGFLVYHSLEWILFNGLKSTRIVDLILLFLLVNYIFFLIKFPTIFYLFILAVPTKISLLISRFKPLIRYGPVHANFQEEYHNSTDRLQHLDVATGSCNPLFTQGWLNLKADYTAVDLSEKMLIKGMNSMSAKEVPVDFIICDATRLPFESETFDIVTNYGAINGLDNPKAALAEMVRVTKRGGKILFLDEQQYESAKFFERAYFKYVFAYYNTIVGCPVNMLPDELEDIQVHQPYEFIYICTARKKRILK